MSAQLTDIFGLISHLNTTPFTVKRTLLDRAEASYGLRGAVLQHDLQRLFPTCDIMNDTDWNYATCFSFLILVQPEVRLPPLSKQNWNAFIKQYEELQFVQFEVSALGPYYVVQYARGSYNSGTTIYTYCTSCQPITEQHQMFAHILNQFCEYRQLSLIPVGQLSVHLPDVTLELADASEVTVYKFLFADGYGENVLTDEIYCVDSRLE